MDNRRIAIGNEINDLVKECHAVAADKGFWDKERNTGEMLMLVTSELGEAMEAHRKGRFANLQGWAINEKNLSFKENFELHIKDSFEDEIADAVIRLFDLCGGLNIDLEAHINLKLKYNKTRERLHGKQY